MAGMHARSTTIHGDPGSVDAGIAYVRDEVMPTLRRMDGCVGLSMLADRSSGRCIVTTSWRDEAALRVERGRRPGGRRAHGRDPRRAAGAAGVGDRRDAPGARGPPRGRSRVTWLRTDPGSVNRAVDAVRLSLMPKLDDLPGFCSVSAMVRRDDGLTVAAVSYDSRADLERADEGAREFREEFAPALGIEVVDTGRVRRRDRPPAGPRDDLTRALTVASAAASRG